MKQMTHQEFQRLLWENAFRTATPLSNMFELTPLCNLDCRMCYVHLQDPSVRERMLKGEQWISIFDEAIRCGMISAILTGGEAMTHPDFWKLYDYLFDQGISLSVKTNGILLTREAVDRFVQYPPSTIDVSIYGCDRISYQTITGHDCFELVDRNLRYAKVCGLPIRLMITPTGLLEPWIDSVLAYAKSFDVKTIVNTQLLDPQPDTGRDRRDYDLSPETILDIRRRANALFQSDQLSYEEEGNGDSASDWKAAKEGLRCAAGRSQFAVTWDGMMVPCITFPRELIACSVLEHGVKGAWEKIHEAVVNYVIPEKCNTCAFREQCNYCPSSHGQYAIRNACNPSVCAFQQGLIVEYQNQKRK